MGSPWCSVSIRRHRGEWSVWGVHDQCLSVSMSQYVVTVESGQCLCVTLVSDQCGESVVSVSIRRHRGE